MTDSESCSIGRTIKAHDATLGVQGLVPLHTALSRKRSIAEVKDKITETELSNS